MHEKSALRLPRAAVAAALFGFCLGHAAARAQTSRPLSEDCRLHTSFRSRFLGNDRSVTVCLPPGYDPEAARRYPVLYMHDGGTVYVLWRMDEVAKRLIASGEIEPLIIVFVDNGGSPEARFEEFTATRPPGQRYGGKADLYGRMLLEELKPAIDAEYRTRTGPVDTGLGGSSLGGLVSLYLGLKYPQTFGKLAVLSPALWAAAPALWGVGGRVLREISRLATRPPLRIWLDVGTGEPLRFLVGARHIRAALLAKGWRLGSDLAYYEQPGGRHSEAAWAQRVPPLLRFLFSATAAPGRRPPSELSLRSQ